MYIDAVTQVMIISEIRIMLGQEVNWPQLPAMILLNVLLISWLLFLLLPESQIEVSYQLSPKTSVASCSCDVFDV